MRAFLLFRLQAVAREAGAETVTWPMKPFGCIEFPLISVIFECLLQEFVL